MKKTVVKLSTFDYRGGTRFKRPLKTGPSILLRYIWLKHGGVEALGRRFGIKSQHFINWQRAGKVPLKRCGEISRELGVCIEALNFDEVTELTGNSQPWDYIVDETTKPDQAAYNQIMRAKMPKYEKGIPCDHTKKHNY